MARLTTLTLITAVLLTFSGAGAQEGKDGDLLRYSFKEGEKFTLSMKVKFRLEFSEMPEEFQGLFGDEPMEVNFDGTMDLAVTKAGKDKSTLSGNFTKLAVKGNMMIQEVDFEYDASKKGQKKEPKKKADPDEFGDEMPFALDFDQALRDMAEKPLELTIDARGKVSGMETQDFMGGLGQGFTTPFVTFHGFAGELPKDKVSKGDTWTVTSQLPIPNLPVKIDLTAKNTHEGKKTVGGLDCAVIRSKFQVASSPNKQADPDAMPFPFDAEITGQGDGTTYFAVAAGHVAQTVGKITVTLAAEMEDPASGDEMSVKMAVSMKQDMTFEKAKSRTEY